MTLLHILTYGSCARGKGKGTEEKKSCVVHIHAAVLSHLQAGLSLACSVRCQPEPSLNRYLPGYHALLHDSLADCKLKGDELST